MLSRTNCPHCAGTGINVIQTSSLWGLLRKDVPSTCTHCSGHGRVVELAHCGKCDGRGLCGNENEICRSCNGTGKIDSFALIPMSLVRTGTQFHRRCDMCGNGTFTIISDIEQHRITKSWEDAEELRQVELSEKVRVHCNGCPNAYHIEIEPQWHNPLETSDATELEALGLDLSFLYQLRNGQPAQPQA
jgi:DnaJ-class molecular chaperone